MVSTDTVVGIVGAALLAVVMVGVFVYEYNNEGTIDPIDDGGGQGTDPAARFAARYPALNATGDLDGDGKDNVDDDDLDQDGKENAVDGDTVFVSSSQATLGPSLPPAVNTEHTLEFVVESGAESVTASVAVTSAQPHNLVVQLLGPGGELLVDETSNAGSPDAFTLEASEGLEPGTYAVRVSQHTAGAGASFSVEARVDYGAPVEADASDKGSPGEVQR